MWMMMDVCNTLKKVFTCLLFVTVSQAVTITQRWKLGTADTCKMAANQSTTYNLQTRNAKTVIQCLSYMQSKDASLRVVSYNGSTSECDLLADPMTVSDNAYQYITEERAFPIPNAADKATCAKPWKKAYEIAADGSVLYGDIASITVAMKAGVDFRIQIIPDLILEVDNIAYKSGQVCASSIFVLSKSSWDMFEGSMYWRFTLVCTDGMVYQGRTYLGKKQSLTPLSSNQHSVWYTRDINLAEPHTNPVYCAGSNLQSSCGYLADIISAVEQGKNVRLAYNFGGSSHYLTSVSRLEVDHESCGVAGQNPWKIGRSATTGKYFSPYYWFVSLFYTLPTREITRWYIGQHLLRSESSQSVFTQWSVEACWDVIFMHNANGENLIGSRKTLIELILQGRRLRLVFGPYSMEADNVVIDDDNVTVQLLSQLDTPTARTFTERDAVWKWVRLSSDGTYAVDLYDLGSSNMKGRTTSSIQAAWVVESRVWRMVLRTDSSGNEIIGSKLDLKQAVSSGSRLRCVVLLQSTLIVTADNIKINIDGNIAAQVFRLISFDANGTSNLIPFWRILIITTNGEMKETRWTVGEHIHRGDVVSRVNINWFVD